MVCSFISRVGFTLSVAYLISFTLWGDILGYDGATLAFYAMVSMPAHILFGVVGGALEGAAADAYRINRRKARIAKQ